MRAKITKRVVDATSPALRDVFVWDAEVPGFGLKVTPAGKRVYVLQYRFGGRKTPWRYTIGPHGAYTPDSARKETVRLRGLISSGINPASDKAATSGAAFTVRDLTNLFLDEHVRARRKQRTIAEYERLCREFIVPGIGRLPVKDVSRADIARLHHGMRKTPFQANRVLAVCSKLFNWAELKGYRSDGSNPCRHVERNPERKRERYLRPSELSALATALSKAEADGLASPHAIGAIRLLLFTGARLTEILTLEWAHVDVEHSCLKLPDSKTGAKIIHLNAPALEVLQSLPIIDGNPFVIVGKKPGAHMVNLQKPWRAVRKLAGLEGLRLHDLRHSFASFGAGAGLGLPMIGALLGHTQAATTHRYAHLADDPLKEASNLIGKRIADAMTETGTGKVARIRRER